MSSRRTHNIAGALAGGAYAFYRAPKNQKPLNNLAEVVGGTLGGIVGSRLPDGCGMAQEKVSPADILRQLTNAAAQRSAVLKANGQHTLQEDLIELLLHLAAGFVSGLPAGYISHLVCDMTTPRSIPLITRGF